MTDKKLPPLRPRKPKVPPRIPDPERKKPTDRRSVGRRKSHINKVET